MFGLLADRTMWSPSLVLPNNNMVEGIGCVAMQIYVRHLSTMRIGHGKLPADDSLLKSALHVPEVMHAYMNLGQSFIWELVNIAVMGGFESLFNTQLSQAQVNMAIEYENSSNTHELRYPKHSVTQIRKMIQAMVGFLKKDPNTGKIVLKDKTQWPLNGILKLQDCKHVKKFVWIMNIEIDIISSKESGDPSQSMDEVISMLDEAAMQVSYNLRVLTLTTRGSQYAHVHLHIAQCMRLHEARGGALIHEGPCETGHI